MAAASGAGSSKEASHTRSPVVVHIGHRELVLRRRYEVTSIANDILIAVWFIVGSLLFFGSGTTTAGTWCFLLGSVELLVRPAIRLSRSVHIRRLRAGSSPSAETSLDF